MVCKKCGAELPDSAVFCPTCGTWVVEKTPPKPAPSKMAAVQEEFLEEPEEEKKESRAARFWKNKKKRDLLLSILTVLAAAACLAMSIVMDNPHFSPSNVVSAFAQASYHQDQEQFLELLPQSVKDYLDQSQPIQNAVDTSLDNFWSRLEEGYQIRVLSEDVITDSSLEQILYYYGNNLHLTVLQARKITVETTYSLYGEPIAVENEITVIQLSDGWYYDLYSNSPSLNAPVATEVAAVYFYRD